MDSRTTRQRIKTEFILFRGRDGSLQFKRKEHSVFLPDGDIVSGERSETPVIQGVVPHEITDVAGQCQSCSSFTTKLLVCELCWEVVCPPCASQRTHMIVCPACAVYLVRRRWILIIRKLFIEPFVEWVG